MVCCRDVEIVIPEKKRQLTYNQLTDILPMQLASFLVDESHRDSPLNSLQDRMTEALDQSRHSES